MLIPPGIALVRWLVCKRTDCLSLTDYTESGFYASDLRIYYILFRSYGTDNPVSYTDPEREQIIQDRLKIIGKRSASGIFFHAVQSQLDVG